MTGPLAQQFAKVRAALTPHGERYAALMLIEQHVLAAAEEIQQIVSALPGHPHGRDAVTYAKDVERHVQDMENALERFIGAYLAGPDYDEAMDSAAAEAMSVSGTTFALPAREKEEE